MAKLTQELVKLTSDVKRANQRLRELEKQGLTDFSKAYSDLFGLAVQEGIDGGGGITGRTKKGQAKFRTDIAKVAKYPDLLKQLKKAVESFLSAPESGLLKPRAERERAKKMQENFENKYGSGFSGQKGLRKMRNILQDEKFFNKLRDYFDSETAAIIYEDVSSGKIDKQKVEEYLDGLEVDRGGDVLQLYQYASTTTDWMSGDW